MKNKEMLDYQIIGKVDGKYSWNEFMKFMTSKEAENYAKREQKKFEKRGWKGVEVSAVPC